MKELKLLAVGRLKKPFWKEAAAHYATRLAHFCGLREIIVKDADSSLPVEERKEREGVGLLRAVQPTDLLIALDEGGTQLDSRAFAGLIRGIAESGKTPAFVIGGAYGLSADVLGRAGRVLSLGRMTFPHEMARVLLLEQLYRAGCILSGSGYHH